MASRHCHHLIKPPISHVFGGYNGPACHALTTETAGVCKSQKICAKSMPVVATSLLEAQRIFWMVARSRMDGVSRFVS